MNVEAENPCMCTCDMNYTPDVTLFEVTEVATVLFGILVVQLKFYLE